jgi:hypothetical protein
MLCCYLMNFEERFFQLPMGNVFDVRVMEKSECLRARARFRHNFGHGVHFICLFLVYLLLSALFGFILSLSLICL